MLPKVTVLCMAYNQEPFIRKTLDGFVMQKTNFPFEVLVHDDASTDKTPEIIREYAEKYPDIIIPILSKENHFQSGRSILIEEFLPRIKGKYVAHCDGDDWWIDENKLQKQADFLDANPDFFICSTCAKVVWADNSHKSYISPDKKTLKYRSVQTFREMFEQNDVINSAVMYRWNFKQSDEPKKNIMPGDWFLHLLHAKYGKLKLLPEPMVVYTRWKGGIWQDGKSAGFYIKNALALMNFYEVVSSKFGINVSLNKGKLASIIIEKCLEENQLTKISDLTKEFPSLIEDISKYALHQSKQVEFLTYKLKRLKQKCYYIMAFVTFIIIFLVFYAL